MAVFLLRQLRNVPNEPVHRAGPPFPKNHYSGYPYNHLILVSCIKFNRFQIDWLKDQSLHDVNNIDHAPDLSEKEKKYLKCLHERSEAGQLPVQPSLGDYKALVEAYGEKYMVSLCCVLISYSILFAQRWYIYCRPYIRKEVVYK